MKKKGRALKYVVLVAIIIAILITVANSLSSKKKISYITIPVTKGNIQKTVLVSGTIRNESRVEVGAQTTGQITAIDVTLGEHVKKGQLIATINSQNQEDDLRNAQAADKSYTLQYKEAVHQLAIAQNNYNINKKLFTAGAISQLTFNGYATTLSTAIADVANLKLDVVQAKIDVSTAQTNLGYTKIIAPISGTIISIPVSVGQTVNSNYDAPTIVQIANLKQMYNEIDIPEANINSIKVGDPVHFNIMNAAKQYTGKIASINPAITTLTDDNYAISVYDTNPVYYYANINVSNPKYLLKIGMLTENTIILANYKNVLLIPSDTIKFSAAQEYVDILVNNKPVKKVIVTGVSNSSETVVLKGLKVGDKVIVSSSVAQSQQ